MAPPRTTYEADPLTCPTPDLKSWRPGWDVINSRYQSENTHAIQEKGLYLGVRLKALKGKYSYREGAGVLRAWGEPRSSRSIGSLQSTLNALFVCMGRAGCDIFHTSHLAEGRSGTWAGTELGPLDAVIVARVVGKFSRSLGRTGGPQRDTLCCWDFWESRTRNFPLSSITFS